MNDKRPYFGEMNVIIPVRPNIQNFEVPGVIVVISPTPNFQVPVVIRPQMSVVIKPKKAGVIATLPCNNYTILIKMQNLFHFQCLKCPA